MPDMYNPHPVTGGISTPCCYPCYCTDNCWELGNCCPDKQPPAFPPEVTPCLSLFASLDEAEYVPSAKYYRSRVVRKPAFCICENKDADQLRGYREADQRLCFRYTDSTIPLLPKSEISSPQPSSVVVQPGLCRKPRRPVFSQRGSIMGF